MTFNNKISIITVVFNGELVLENTILSILNQSFTDIEYIIIDGKSMDGTINIIRKYEDRKITWISEADRGLYDAMNKGLHLASGEYVLFLNAGDQFYNEDVLKQIFSASEPGADIYYGETMIMDNRGKDIGMRRLKAPSKLSWKSLIDGMLVCHQSFIVRKSICRDYNLDYKIAADYDWMLNCLKNTRHIVNSNIIISRFLDGGLNKHNIRKALAERFQIMIHNYNFFLVVLNHVFIGFRFAVSYYKNKRF